MCYIYVKSSSFSFFQFHLKIICEVSNKGIYNFLQLQLQQFLLSFVSHFQSLHNTYTYIHAYMCVCVCLCMRFSFAFCAALPTFSIWICLLWQLLNWPVRLHNVCVPVYVCVSVCVAHYTLIHVFKAFFSFALRCCWVECAYMKRHNTLGAHCTLSVRNEAYAWCAAVCPRLQSAS